MKLINLNPRWYVAKEGGHKIGLTFLCPHCQLRRLGVAFRHDGPDAIYDEEPDTHGPGDARWLISGDHLATDFHNVTLTPSIDASAFGCWHGFITDSNIT